MQKKDGVYYNLCNLQTFDENEDDKGRKSPKEVQKWEKKAQVVKQVGGVKKTEVEAGEEAKVSWIEIMKLNLPEWRFISAGTGASAVLGGLQPSFAIIVAEILGNYSKYACGINGNENPPAGIMSKSECASTLNTNMKLWSIVLVAIGILHLFGYIIGKTMTHLGLNYESYPQLHMLLVNLAK